MTTHSTTVHSGTDDAALARETSPTFPTAPAFRQLTRTPLVPEAVLKRHGAYCAIDTRFRSAARLLQCLWLKDHDIPTASSARRGGINTGSSFGSILEAGAARAGRNFLSPAIHRLALQELLLREDDAAIDEERLFGNALSSMPLTFSLFGPLAVDCDLATAVFRRLLPDFVHTVEQIIFEHSPGRREDRFLKDRTAFDLAVRVITPDGEPATVFIEVKYSESMEGPAARMRDRYNEASRQVRLYRDPDSAILRSLALEQIWREHMTAQLAVDHGVTPRAVFMAIGPHLNRRVQAAFRVYEAELLDADQREPGRVAFAPLTLETVIEAVATAGASELAHALWGRYCDLDRVYRLSMQEIAGTEVPPDAPPHADSSASIKRALPPVRRRSPSSNRHRTKASSSACKVAAKATSTQEAI
ncbi:hypothetical protein SAMN05444158_4853 [Bradyrhizobium canariense]|uniref:PD-(D/E)XK nuclease-like domain-containing protein n=2 Tax=Bradyrhizobium canariense TaxID=255045 RepID=A0A1H1YJN4_9BRAD|nr:hypothetical protein SAMN05444158_4853 [Bradyrhizobium canariense]